MTALDSQIRLAARPRGLPTPSDWQQTQEPVAEAGDGEMLVRVSRVALDPAVPGRGDERRCVPPAGIGEVMRATGELVLQPAGW